MKRFLKRTVSFTLALIIIFGAAGFTFSGAETTENVLTFKSELFRYNESAAEWVKAEKAAPGESIKVRIYVETSYCTGPGNFLVFYDNSFFEDEYQAETKNTLKVNPENEAISDSSVFCKYNSESALIKNLVSNGYLTQNFADSHNAYAIIYYFSYETATPLSGSCWIAEFDLKVKADATGKSGFTVVPETVKSPERTAAYADIPVGQKDVSWTQTVSLGNVSGVIIENSHADLTATDSSDFTFHANGGKFSETVSAEEIYIYSAKIGEAFNCNPQPQKEGYSFVGWVNEHGESVSLPATVPNEDKDYYAAWKAVDYRLTLDANGGKFADGTNIYTDILIFGDDISAIFAKTPTKEGYYFKGWTDENGSLVADINTMPAADLNLTALWYEERMEVLNAPSSAIYKGSLDLSGTELKVPDGNGSYDVVTDTSKMKITGFDSSKIGEQTVTVEYEGYTAEFEVTVSYAWWQWIIRILLLGFIWY